MIVDEPARIRRYVGVLEFESPPRSGFPPGARVRWMELEGPAGESPLPSAHQSLEPAHGRLGLRTRGGDAVRKLPDRVWKLPRHEDDEAAEEGMGRILALSDGVFAIAITLLILEIAVPATTGNADLSKALLGLWPRYLAYVLCFVVIARFWVTHHLAFRLIARYDAVLAWLDL